MNIFEYKIIISVILMTIKVDTEKVISDEDNDKNARKNKHLYNIYQSERRFIDNLNDEEWHVSHLKNVLPEHSRRSGCKEETFEERAKKYRKMLQNDGALVEYVSSDPLPFNLKDLEPDICRIPEKSKKIYKPLEMTTVNSKVLENWKVPTETVKKKTPVSVNVTVTANSTDKVKDNITNSASKKKLTTPMDMEQKDTATTITTEKPESKGKEGRRGDYMFSSVEYYDEILGFDISTCPDDVEEISLEVDHIRDYDVQCELLLEWRSLE